MENNPLQFAVVREDPDALIDIIKNYAAQNILMVASGGCTALSLYSLFPDLKFTLYDANQHQIEHVKKKISALNEKKRESLFNIERNNPDGLNECGNFERLFKGLREYIYEFVLDYNGFREVFTGSVSRDEIQKVIFNNRHWSIAYEKFFNDSLLNSMFGKEATQNAIPESYVKYFKQVIEKGFSKSKFEFNYFLHHTFLGHYLKKSLPTYLKYQNVNFNFDFINCSIDKISDFDNYDLIDFSNIFDWCDQVTVKRVVNRCNKEVKPGTIVVFRQLNNFTNLIELFNDQFDFSESSKVEGIARDLFYNKYNVGIKRKRNE